MPLSIVDAQVHIWAESTPERPWPARHAPHRPVPITAESLLADMAEAGVQRAVLVPPSWEGERNDVCLAAAQAYPDRFAVMGRLDDPRTVALVDAARTAAGPYAVVAAGDPDDPRAAAAVPLLAGRPLVDGAPAAYACSGFACRAPVSDPSVLMSALRGD
jgi:uncharacterized protein YyaL (SSP411 family)